MLKFLAARKLLPRARLSENMNINFTIFVIQISFLL